MLLCYVTDVNECSSSPCEHGATCEDKVNYYICHCSHGYTGIHCETGKCIGIHCETGKYTGIHCEIGKYTGIHRNILSILSLKMMLFCQCVCAYNPRHISHVTAKGQYDSLETDNC